MVTYLEAVRNHVQRWQDPLLDAIWITVEGVTNLQRQALRITWSKSMRGKGWKYIRPYKSGTWQISLRGILEKLSKVFDHGFPKRNKGGSNYRTARNRISTELQSDSLLHW